MDRSDASALTDLQMHWDEAYTIGLDGDIWSATFHGSADELRAHTSHELRELIRADYAYRQQAGNARAAGRTDLDDDDLDYTLDYGLDDEDDHEEDGAGSDSEGAAGSDARPPQVSFADIHGERMST